MKSPNTESAHGLNRMAFRLFVRHRGRMLFFALCIAIGVGFLFGLNTLLVSFNQSIAGKARELMAADISLVSSRAFDPPTEKLVRSLASKGRVQTTRMLQFASMLRVLTPGTSQQAPFLVSVKAIQPHYPFYGKFLVHPANYRDALFKQSGCLLAKSLAKRYGLKRGDRVKMGQSEFTVVGFIQNEPDRMLSFAGLAPRVVISYASAPKTGLIRLGSRVSRILLLKTLEQGRPPATIAAALKKKLVDQLKDPYLRINAYSESQPTIREVLQRVATFFIFVSLVALMLGSIGMAASVTTFLNSQLHNVGIFRCLGLSPKDVTRIYQRLCLGMGLLGGALGLLLGLGLSYATAAALNQWLQAGLSVNIHWSHPLEAVFLACALTIGLNYAAVQSLARLTPQEILKGQVQRLQISRSGLFATVGIFVLGFFLYAFKTAYSFPIATFFTLLLIGLLLVCSLMIFAVLGGLSVFGRLFRGSRPLSFALRHGIRQLVRQRVRTLTFLLSLTLGVTLISTLNFIQYSLVTEIRFDNGQQLPSAFLVDVQKDQRSGVRKLLKSYPHKRAKFNPLVRARLTHINGQPVTRSDLKGMTMEARSRARLLTREQNLTYRDRLNPSETITAGKFWKPGTTNMEVSIERRFANRIGTKVGDLIRFDIQGRSIETKVTSLRNVNWMSLTPNFFVLLPKHVLEGAPQIFITSITLNKQDKDLPHFQNQLNQQFPNVSVIPVQEIFQSVSRVLTYFIQMLQGLAWVCVFIGLLILAGTLSMGRNERRNKVAMLRSLGSRRSTIILIDIVEFLSIGSITAILVAGLSWSMTSIITSQMGIRFHFPNTYLIEMGIATMLLPLIVGLFSNRAIYRAGVMENLRNSA